MNIIYQLITFLCSCALMYFIYKFFCCWSAEHHYKRKTYLMGYLIGLLAFSLIPLSCNLASRNLLALFVCVFLSFFHIMHISYRCISTALLWSVLCGINFFLIHLSAKGNLALFAAHSFHSAIGSILFLCLVQLFLLLLCVPVQSLLKKDFVLMQWLPQLCLPVSLILLCALSMLFEINQNDRRFHFKNIEFLAASDSPDLLFYLSCTGLLFLNILIPYLCQRTLDLKKEQKEKERITTQNQYFQNQFTLLHSSGRQVRSIRHDMRNHLAVIRSMIGSQNQEAFQYLNGLLGDINTNFEISSTGNLLLDSLINYKFRNYPADKLDISYHASIPEDLSFNACDLTVILGNLIDNAIEAATKCPEGNRKIELTLNYSNGCLIIEIANTFTGELISNERGYFTTKKQTDSHGFGLLNIRHAVEKHGGTVSFSQEGKLFRARVIINP